MRNGDREPLGDLRNAPVGPQRDWYPIQRKAPSTGPPTKRIRLYLSFFFLQIFFNYRHYNDRDLRHRST